MITTPIHQTDGYKVDHKSQYPEGTNLVYSNFTPRSTRYAQSIEGLDNRIVVFGLQYFIKWFLMSEFQSGFFDQPREDVLRKYKRRIDNYLGKDSVDIQHIGDLHDLGYLPISIRALPEGSLVDARIPVLTIENTIPEFFWLTNFFETIMSCMLWKPSTSATTAYKYKQLLMKYAEETGGDADFVPFQGHDFSFRGMSGIQDAQMSGAGHLLSFVGTDAVPAIDFLEEYYNANSDEELVGCSVPATEHSVMCMGSKDGEIETFQRLISEVYPSGIVSIVSDTWDFWKVVTEFLPALKGEIMERDGKVVIRPDSGDPIKIICGDPEATEGSPEFKGAVECLAETFGGITNEKGYKVLDSHIGLIYGDSITLERCDEICSRLKAKGFCSTNVVLGIGSFTYEYVTRDTLGWAMKATAGEVKGEFREIFKDPKTDDGMKKSARGYLSVLKDASGRFHLQDQVTEFEFQTCDLEEVYRDGTLLVDHSLSEIRNRLG